MKQLQKAVRENNSELTVALLRKGAPADAETEGGLTAIIRAVLNSDVSMLRMVVEVHCATAPPRHRILTLMPPCMCGQNNRASLMLTPPPPPHCSASCRTLALPLF